jgi:tRNA(adenine34) deaminase
MSALHTEDADIHWMRAALHQAELAGASGEVPVGAVVVHQGELLAAAGNAPIALKDPSAHAELLALRQAAQVLGNYRLEDCELFVTLEPCVMCAGAILQARLKRVVFAIPEPKTGAAGSVVDVFANPLLNHHTAVEHGVLAQSCQHAMQAFFKNRRSEHKQQHHTLREDALRTPDARFAPWLAAGMQSRYWCNLPALVGLRLHALERVASAGAGAPVVVCLHGPQDWSLSWAQYFPASPWRDAHVLCPDLIGFGRSDKPKREAFHSLDWHVRALLAWLDHVQLSAVHILCHPDMFALAQELAQVAGTRVLGVHVQAPPDLPLDARTAPFPDRGHQAGPRAFQKLLAARVGPSS